MAEGYEGLKSDAVRVIREALGKVQPAQGVKDTLQKISEHCRRLYVVSVGKAAYRMAKAASEELGNSIYRGYVITKYGHAGEPLPHFMIYEAGHPTPDESGVRATEAVLNGLSGLTSEDIVLFLLSGGASALFEKPAVPLEELKNITEQLLMCGADINETNTIRKHLSLVKGGKFAKLLAPARIYTVILSDVIGNRLDSVGSGPTCPDMSTTEDALNVVDKYALKLSSEAYEELLKETPKSVKNVYTTVIGDCRILCTAAKAACEALGYRTVILTETLDCEAREAGSFIASVARQYETAKENLAFIFGGETVVHVRGTGMGGRNQELVLGAAEGIAGLKNVCVFSVGSDGTDGPTDAAGGIVFPDTAAKLKAAGLSAYKALAGNDAYHALQAVNSLIVTGPTGTNVNDLSVLLIKHGPKPV